MPKYPEVTVKLIGENSNAMSIIGKTTKAMREKGVDPSECRLFTEQAMSGDYNNVLRTVMKWVTVQ